MTDNRERFEELLGLSLDGDATLEQEDELEEMLAEDPVLAHEANEEREIAGLLRAVGRRRIAPPSLTAAVLAELDKPAPARVESIAPPPPVKRGFRGRLLGFAAAAVVVGGSGLAYMLAEKDDSKAVAELRQTSQLKRSSVAKSAAAAAQPDAFMAARSTATLLDDAPEAKPIAAPVVPGSEAEKAIAGDSTTASQPVGSALAAAALTASAPATDSDSDGDVDTAEVLYEYKAPAAAPQEAPKSEASRANENGPAGEPEAKKQWNYESAAAAAAGMEKVVGASGLKEENDRRREGAVDSFAAGGDAVNSAVSQGALQRGKAAEPAVPRDPLMAPASAKPADPPAELASLAKGEARKDGAREPMPSGTATGRFAAPREEAAMSRRPAPEDSREDAKLYMRSAPPAAPAANAPATTDTELPSRQQIDKLAAQQNADIVLDTPYQETAKHFYSDLQLAQQGELKDTRFVVAEMKNEQDAAKADAATTSTNAAADSKGVDRALLAYDQAPAKKKTADEFGFASTLSQSNDVALSMSNAGTGGAAAVAPAGGYLFSTNSRDQAFGRPAPLSTKQREAGKPHEYRVYEFPSRDAARKALAALKSGAESLPPGARPDRAEFVKVGENFRLIVPIFEPTATPTPRGT